MEFQLDRDLNALYIRFRLGVVSRTIELTDSVHVDVDVDDVPLGMEFSDANQFGAFLRDDANDDRVPPWWREMFRVSAA